MRLIGTFETEKQAYAFYSFLLKEGVKNIYESYTDAKTNKKGYHLWIFDEDDFPIANDYLSQFTANPEDPRFLESGTEAVAAPAAVQIAKEEDAATWKTVPPVRVKVRAFHLTLTHLLIFLCVALFFWNNVEKEHLESDKGAVGAYLAHTPIERELLFDYPRYFQEVDQIVESYDTKDMQDLKAIPPPMQKALNEAGDILAWKGLYAFFSAVKKEGWKQASQVPLFEEIRQGQVWRLFTPCLLHFDLLHILFNLSWVLILGKQIEERIHWKKLGLLVLLIGIVSNTAQYIVSGPSFLGFSGVIVGMAAFIWMRQKAAPWEGYPLSRGVLLFLLLFVAAMVGLGVLTFFLKAFSLLEIAPMIANSAHVVGGIVGMLLGRWSFFARGKQL
jgi:GlpG protein